MGLDMQTAVFEAFNNHAQRVVEMQTVVFEALNDHARRVAELADRLGRVVGESITPPGQGKKHTFLMYGRPFEVDVKYLPIKALGKGAFGLVCSCLDRETGEQVAVKKIGEVLRNRFQDVYLVQELMDYDLRHVIDSTRLSETECRYALFKILRGVEYLHSVNVIHRDLKPENVLVRRNGDIKISDFGHARTRYKGSGPMTVHIGTTGYIAPEILLGSRNYEDSVDMWSVGCIFAEMLIGEPMFNGRDNMEQIKQIFGFLGKQQVARDLGFVECSKTRRLLEELPPSRLSDSASRKLYGDADFMEINLLERMLALNPKKRISAKEALEHPYFSAMHVPYPLLPNPVRSSGRVRLKVDETPNGMSAEMIREMIWEEVLLYDPQQQQQQQQRQQQFYSLF